MSDGFNARNEIITAFNNLANPDKLQEFKKAIDNFEKDDPLFNTLSFNGKEFTLSQKGSNGEFEAVSEDKFKKFINTIAKEYGIDLDDVADDAELMFKILDNDGNGILEADELQALKDSDANESKSRKNKKDIIDGFTLRRYFSGIDKEVLLEEYALIEDINNLPETSDDMLAIKHGVDVEDIKEIRNGDNNDSSSNSIPDFVDKEKIINFAGRYEIDATVDDIKADLEIIYGKEESPEDIDKLARIIKGVVGTRYDTRNNHYYTCSYYDEKKDIYGNLASKYYYREDGSLIESREYTHSKDGRLEKEEYKNYKEDGTIYSRYTDEYTYDARGRLTQKTRKYYDENDKLISTTIYDKDNNIISD